MKKLLNVLLVLTAVAAVPVNAMQQPTIRRGSETEQKAVKVATVVAAAALGAGLTALAVTALYNAVYGEVDCGVVKEAYCAGSEVAPVAYELCKEHLPHMVGGYCLPF